MSEIPLRLRSISDLIEIEEKFHIPSYQRGYRWTVQQIEDLLKDIWEFSQNVQNNKSSGFYCLQPIVVKRNSINNLIWDVIDGQQRLTTLYILLTYFDSISELLFGNKNKYSITYETRNDSEIFLENIKNINNENICNIDYFHMSSAFLTINKWFDKSNINKVDFLNTLKRKDEEIDGKNIAKNVRIIWYEVEKDEQNEIDIFTRINMGKIPLTNAELIKALLLKSDNEFKKDKQFELATEWDSIEYSLQNDEFWYFLNSDDNKSTRIEFIFELLTDMYIKDFNIEKLNTSIDNYYTFHVFNEVMNTDKKNKNDIWEDVKNYFRIFNEWFENKELFHKIGFLISENKQLIKTLVFESKHKTKREFKITLDEKIKDKLEKVFNKKSIYELEFDTSKEAIKQTLLLFNIKTLIDNKESNIRFQFDRFKKENWDIEHIRSQNDKEPFSKSDKEAWIEDVISLGYEIPNKAVLVEKNSSDDFTKKYKEIEKLFDENKAFDKASISNLALLDAGTNRSYKNAFFPIKRKTILENDMNGIFIPICTRNVFMKYYTKNVDKIRTWDEKDADDYLDAIIKTLKEYLPNQDIYNAE